ncbi:MAG: hypothetical protein JWM80_274 [Cyanobacteria bacterium RYN_339]|nr:hypothetical protein [Cyanobacteria bacterium RYN_339]
MFRHAAPMLAAALFVTALAGPARADETSDAIAASQGLVKDAHAVTGLVLESLDALEAVAGDAETRAKVAKVLAEYKKANANDANAVKSFGPQLADLAAAVDKAGFKSHPLSGKDAAALKTALLKINAAGIIAASTGGRAAELGQKASSLMMANPFGAMGLKPIADNAMAIGSLAAPQVDAVKQASEALGQLATESKMPMPSLDEAKAMVKQLAPGVPL